MGRRRNGIIFFILAQTEKTPPLISGGALFIGDTGLS
jgi:hypothetical protein